MTFFIEGHLPSWVQLCLACCLGLVLTSVYLLPDCIVAEVEAAVAELLHQPVHLVQLAVLPVQLLLARTATASQLSYWGERLQTASIILDLYKFIVFYRNFYLFENC